MSIRQGSNYIAGGSSQVNVDNLTINKNASNEIQAISLINQNDQSTNIKLWLGSEEDYEAVETKDENTVYFTKDGVIDISGEGSGSLEIGDIGIAPFGIDESQNKRRYLNGQVISQSQFVSFTNRIKAVIQLNPNLAATEENWQAEVTNSKLGQCGKFVIDDALGTIRLPKVVNIQGLQDLALMGSTKTESLPNITGSFTPRETAGYASGGERTGAFYIAEQFVSNYVSGASGSGYKMKFDASRSSSTYQDNAPVQQEAIQYPYFIQVAKGSEDSVDVTREIELNNPFSLLDYKWSEYELNNASWLLSNGAFHSGATYVAVYELLLKIHNGTETKEGVSVKLSTEAYADTDFVINTADTTFRLPIKVKLASGNAVVGNGMTTTYTDINGVEGVLSSTNNDGNRNAGTLFADGINIYGVAKLTTDPTKSGIETSSNGLKLYFYVGETIQDANVIVASNVLTNAVMKNSSADRKTVVSWGMPDYSAGVGKAANTQFTAESDGFLLYNYAGATSTNTLTINGISINLTTQAQYSHGVALMLPIPQGTTYKLTGGGNKLIFYPLKGVN